MIWIRALIRALIIAVAIWVGQLLLPPSHKAGIWAMVSLGIASALVGLVLIEVVGRRPSRLAEAAWHFFSTLVIMEAFYLLLPRVSLRSFNADFILALGVAVVSGLSQWLVRDDPIQEH